MAKKNIQVVYTVTDAGLLKAEKSLKANEEAAKKADNAVKKYGDDAKRAGDGASKSFGDLKNLIATIGLIQLGRQIIEVTGNFQKFSAVLKNTLGSQSEANKALKNIQEFAAKTPFGVQELTASFVKLANQGFRPTINELKKLGDLAASMGKSFDQLTEAIIDAQTGEFERLKEFGIRAQKEGDRVTFTFKGVKTQTDFTSEAIRNYVLALGDATGVSGSMEAISGTLQGRISNLGDSFDNLLLTIGTLTSGPMFETIEALTTLVNVTANLNKELALIGQAVSPFHDLSDVSKQTIDYLMKIGRTDSGKNLSDVLAPFTSQEAVAFLKNYDENRKLFVKTLEAEGESLDDINTLWLRYVETQIAAAKESKAAKTAENLNEIKKATESAAMALEKLAAARKKDAFEQSEIDRLRRIREQEGKSDLEPIDEFKEKYQVRVKVVTSAAEAMASAQETLADRVDAANERQNKSNEKLHNQQMQLRQQSFDYGIDLLQQLLMASLDASDRSFEREKGNFDQRLAVVGDNERARMEIMAEREQFELEQDAKAEQFQKEKDKREKERQVKQMIIQNVSNALRALGTPPVPNFPLAAITALFGLAQIGVAKSIGFKEGVIDLKGPGTGTSDSIPARLSRGESVINAESTSRSMELLEGINSGKIDDSILRSLKISSGGVTVVNKNEGMQEAIENLRVDHHQYGHFVIDTVRKGKNLRQHMISKHRNS